MLDAFANNWTILVISFFIYSFCGWIWESLVCPGSLTVVFIFSLTKSLKTLIISMLLSFFIVKFVKIYVLTWANVCYNRHRR